MLAPKQAYRVRGFQARLPQVNPRRPAWPQPDDWEIGTAEASGCACGSARESATGPKGQKSCSQFFISRRCFLRHYSRMGKRREARERAVQFLFQHDLNPPEDLELELAQFWNSQRAAAIEEEKGPANWGEKVELPPPTAGEAETRLFAEPLIRGVLEHREAIDARIKSHAKNWDFHRIAAVDRNIMRLAIFEMLHREDIPPVVSINEAVDIAKKFSTQDSGKFVNGILDKVRGEILRPAKTVK
jgi:N utilization substance protein B